MCLPYSVPAMGPYSTGFPVARQPGLHSPPNDVSCLRRPTLPGSTLLPQVRRCRRHRRSHRVAGRFSMGDCGSCARRTGDCTRIASHRKSTWSREHGAVCVQLRAPCSRYFPDVSRRARESSLQSRHDPRGGRQERQRSLLSSHGAGGLWPTPHARRRRPLSHGPAAAGGRRSQRRARPGRHHSARDSDAPLHLCTARACVQGAWGCEAGSTRIRRLPSQRAGRNDAEPARVRRPFRRADQLQSRSLSSNGSAFGHMTTRSVSRVPYPGIIRVAHSPDADDAFMFWAMATGKIDTGGRRYVHELADIETLNRRALSGELEVTAVSLHAYAYLADRYALLAHGASIGDRYGPRLVAREAAPGKGARSALAGRLVAVAGELTTARTDEFVGMYVNAYTVDYGTKGRRAVAELLDRARAAGLLPGHVDLAFVAADS